jgi:bacterioferritin-associated ferredoxin
MIVCSCNVLSDRDIRSVVGLSAHTVSQVYKQLGCSAKCGRCAYTIKEIVQDSKAIVA